MNDFRKTPDELLPILENKVTDFYNCLTTDGWAELWQKSYHAYYAGWKARGNNEYSGKAGERTIVRGNAYKEVIGHIRATIAGSRPAFIARAVNTDYKSMAQATVANDVLQSVVRDKKIEDLDMTTIDRALRYGTAYLGVTWDESKGEDTGEITADEGGDLRIDAGGEEVRARKVYAGDIVIESFLPHDVAVDVSEGMSQQWCIVRRVCDKETLAARYPKFRDEIEAGGIDAKHDVVMYERTGRNKSNNCIEYWTLYHRDCLALPGGRETVYISGTVLADGTLKYKDLPIVKLTLEDFDGQPFGNTVCFDLLSLNRLHNAMLSVVATNAEQHGVMNVYVPEGSNLTLTDTAPGVRFVKYRPIAGAVNAGLPAHGEQPSTSPDVYRLYGAVRQMMDGEAGLNYVSTGSQETSGLSGSAMALLENRTIQFLGVYGSSVTRFREKWAMTVLQCFQVFAKTPRTIAIAGRGNSAFVKQFDSSKIDKINLVTIESASPLTQTASGRQQFVEMLVNSGALKDPRDILSVMDTGRVDQMYATEHAQNLLVLDENEKLGSGQCQVEQDPATGQDRCPMVPVLYTDDDTYHIDHHNVVLSSVDARLDNSVVQPTLAHIAEHEMQRQLKAQKIQEEQASMAQPAPGGPMEPPIADGQPTGNESMAPEDKGPRMPTNPVTGSQNIQPGA